MARDNKEAANIELQNKKIFNNICSMHLEHFYVDFSFKQILKDCSLQLNDFQNIQICNPAIFLNTQYWTAK
jgi:hypothetical protein